jgi:hypothetical protein
VYNATVIVCIIDIIILALMNIKKASKNLQDFGIALFSEGIFYIVACKIVTSKVNIDGIKIINDSFSKTLVTIINDFLVKIVSLGAGSLIIAIVLIAIYVIIVINKKSKNEREEPTTNE